MSGPIENWFKEAERRTVELKSENGRTVQISCHLLGQGDEWITFIHGFPTCSYDFIPVIQGLKKTKRLFLFDMLGYGDSDKDLDPSFCVNQQADILLDLWKQIGIKRTHIVSHDLGDSILQEVLTRSQATEVLPTLEKIFIFNGGLFPDLHRPILMQKILLTPVLGYLASFLISRATFKGSFSSVFAPEHQPSDEELDEHFKGICNRDGHKNYYITIRYILDRRENKIRWEKSLSDACAERQGRVCFYWGMLDPVSGAHAAEEIHKRLDQFKVTVVERHDLGHYPMLEDPKSVSEALENFFQVAK